MKTTRKKRSILWKLPRGRLQKIVDESNSFKDILIKMQLCEKGNNWQTLKARLTADEIDTSKLIFNRAMARKNQGIRKTIPLSEILKFKSSYNRTHLKKRLLKEALLKNECAKCHQGPEWFGSPLSLQLDHINGIPDDNRIENIRLLCPNCHSQTETFAGRKQNILTKKKNVNPRPHFRKVVWPSKDELEKLLWSIPTTKIARKYGVSDKAVEKWSKIYDLSKPPRGYWSLQRHSGEVAVGS